MSTVDVGIENLSDDALLQYLKREQALLNEAKETASAALARWGKDKTPRNRQAAMDARIEVKEQQATVDQISTEIAKRQSGSMAGELIVADATDVEVEILPVEQPKSTSKPTLGQLLGEDDAAINQQTPDQLYEKVEARLQDLDEQIDNHIDPDEEFQLYVQKAYIKAAYKDYKTNFYSKLIKNGMTDVNLCNTDLNDESEDDHFFTLELDADQPE